MVVRFISEGKGPVTIAVRLRRTTASVKARMRELRLAEDVALQTGVAGPSARSPFGGIP
jgi:hypothetical protein